MQATFKSRFLPYLFLAPTLIVLALFLYYPVLSTLQLSAYRSFLGLRQKYVGLDNYVGLLSPAGDGADYASSFVITIIFSTLVVVGGIGLSLGLALLASQKIRGIRFYRTLLIWPYALSTAIAGSIFLFLFNQSVGVMTYVVDALFHVRPAWISDPGLAPWVVAMAAIWKALGYNVIFYIAGLQTIPRDVLEAAAIDGATSFQRFWRVVFPLLSPFTFFLVITNVSYAFFDTFATVSVLTGGSQNTNTNTLMFTLYRDAFVDHKTGQAAAQSILLFVMVAAITAIQFRVGERQVTYGA